MGFSMLLECSIYITKSLIKKEIAKAVPSTVASWKGITNKILMGTT